MLFSRTTIPKALLRTGKALLGKWYGDFKFVITGSKGILSHLFALCTASQEVKSGLLPGRQRGLKRVLCFGFFLQRSGGGGSTKSNLPRVIHSRNFCV